MGEPRTSPRKQRNRKGARGHEGGESEEVNALNGAKCYICNKNWHTAPNWPRRGKGEGKGKVKGKGKDTKGSKGGKGTSKGKGGGPKGGCWKCGGNHYEAQCPNQTAQASSLATAFHLGSLVEKELGKVESGEDDAIALKREIREELSLEIGVHEFIAESEVELSERIIRMRVYRCSVVDMTCLQCSDHSEIRWIQKSDLFKLAWAPADIPILSVLAERL